MRTYRAPRSTILFTNGFLALIVLVIVMGILYAEPTILYAVFLLFALWRWYQILSAPTEIRVMEDGSIEFRGVIGRRSVRPEEVTLLKKVARGYYLECPTGSLNLYGNMAGIEEFVAYLRSANPGLEVEGAFGVGKA